jgi:tryptophan synthase alpha chain
VIVGSALIRCVLEAPDEVTGRDRLQALSAELAEGVRTPRS